MDALTWSKIQPILAALIDAPLAQRAALLASLCRDDSQLRAEVEALLACEDELPEQLPDALFQSLAEPPPQASRIGEGVGAFEIESCLGEGGSSVVYAARRVNDFTQRVAIKLLRDHAGVAVARRFAIERETLSRLSHPHIGKLFDAGTLSDATPYLVLELVQGRVWAQWLSEERPPLRERITKFLSICGAVEYAHQQLLVHRDIKPGNLMIDREGRAMLLDFGIAKLLGDSSSATLTRDGGFALTPAYAAPEQLRGEPVSTATDVYGLGLVLFETLTARHAFDTGGVVSATQRMRDPALLPKRPSQVAAATPAIAALAEIPANHAVPAQLLRGDLDNIVMKALDPEPARRYASVAALASDLRAWLEGRPVSARAQGWRYVAAKFVRRHPIGTALTLAALMAIATALIIATQETRRARRHLAEARTLAHDILTEYPEQIAELPGSLPVQARMVHDAVRYLDSLRAVAGEDGALLHELAAGYLRIGDLQGNPYTANLGDVAGAQVSYSQAQLALDQWRQLSLNAPGMAILQARLSSRMAALDHQQSRLAVSDRGFRKALDEFAALPPDARDAAVLQEHAATLDFHGDLLGNSEQASLLDAEAGTEKHAQARQMLADGLVRHPHDFGLQLGYATSLERAGDDAFFARDLALATTRYRESMQRIETLLADHPTRVSVRRGLAGLNARLSQVLDLDGKRDAAIAASAQSVAIIEALLASDPTNDNLRQGAGAGLGVLAKMLIRAGRFAEAGPAIDRQIAVNQHRLETSPGNAEMVLALSLGYRRRGEQRLGLGDYAGAREAHQRALELQTRIAADSVDNESHRALTLLHLGRVARAAGDGAHAETRLREAITAMNALVTAHPDVPVYREDLIDAEEAMGDTLTDAKSAPHFIRAIELIDSFTESGALAPAFRERRAEIERKAASTGSR